MKRLTNSAALAGIAAMAAAPAWAQDAITFDKGDITWMSVATVLVLLMTLPGLALFYGGLVRSKNMLSVLTQVFAIVAIVAVIWIVYGYSLAFSDGGALNPYVGGLSKMFLAGIDLNTPAATFSNGVYIPEYVFIMFQMTFACITPALIVGAFAERVKFSALLVFVVLWVTFIYFPMAHMVWWWGGPDYFAAQATILADPAADQAAKDAASAALAANGLIFNWGALDFAGGTVVHINAGIAGLVGCLVPLSRFDPHWRAHLGLPLRPKEEWVHRQRSITPPLFFSGGLLLTFITCALYVSNQRRSEFITHQVNVRTAELMHTQDLLKDDIRKRQTAEADLRESRRQIDSLVSQLPGMAYRYDAQRRYAPLFISQGSVDIIGLTAPELLSPGSPRFADFIHPEDRPRYEQILLQAITQQQPYELEYRLHHRDGSLKWLLDRGQPILSADRQVLFIEGLVIDITTRKQAEDEKALLNRRMLESQKLESLGVLASGIAHDFNNLLTTILGHANIVRMDLPKDSPLQKNLPPGSE